MDGEKAKKMIAAGVSTAVLLLFILVSILIYQLVLMGKTRSQINNLNDEIQNLEQQNEESQNEIDVWLNNWKITERANELGWLYGEDK